MKISNIECKNVGENRVRISASMDESELWYNIPYGVELPETLADSFVVMALAPSMLKRQPLEVASNFPVSPDLISNLQEIQKIFHCWNTSFKIVPVRASTATPSEPRDAHACMFSGGVDSLHTLMRHNQEVSEAILIGGFDLSMNSDSFMESAERNERIACHLGAGLFDVHTNQLTWSAKTGVSRLFSYSSYLASVALFFRNKSVLIPSSSTYAFLGAAGSHVILDHMWSNGCTEFVHSDIDVPRSEKIKEIIRDPMVLRELRVCWNNQNENCGECSKCLRTMLTLELLGVSGPFPRKITASDVKKFVVNDWRSVEFLMDNLSLAKKHARGDMIRALRKAFRRYERREALLAFDSGVLGGTLRRLRNKMRAPATPRAGLIARYSDLDC